MDKKEKAKKKLKAEDIIINAGRKKGGPLTPKELIQLNKDHPQVQVSDTLKELKKKKALKKLHSTVKKGVDKLVKKKYK
jgi:hypothetical protein